MSATGGSSVGSSCGSDPPTGHNGLKWETGGGVPICSGSTCNGGGAVFAITLSGSVPVGCVKAVNKIATSNAWGCVQGPSCADCVTDADCDDGNVCNGAEACVDGACQPGVPLDCDDDLCTIDTCDPVLGCQNTPKNCNDGVGCTVDTCDPDTGECVNTPDDSFCDDGLFCNGQQWCHLTLGCQAGTPPDCDDGIDCTIDKCDEVNNTCTNQPKHSLCDDGIHCNGIEMCDPQLGCVPGKPPVCDDGIDCTNSFCDEDQAKCVHIPDDSLCDDDVYCNGEEFCDPLFGCRAGTPVACDDGIDCTTGVCDEATQSCVFTPHNSLCQDGQYCNGQEVCNPELGCRPGEPMVCDDGIVCTVGFCDEAHDICRFTPSNTQCDDGDPCTQGGCESGNGSVYTTNCGACCVFGGGCVDGVNEFDCQLLGPALFMGVGTTCTASRGEVEDICPELIPTVSEWGLVILTLLLLAGAKVSFGRRRSAMAS